MHGARYRPESSFIPSEGRRLWIATRKARCVKQRHIFFPFPIGVRVTANSRPPRQLRCSREAVRTVLHSQPNLYIFFNRVASKFGIKVWRGISARTFYLDWKLTEIPVCLLAYTFYVFLVISDHFVNSESGLIMIRNN